MRVLGIDPGIERVGWGVVDFENNNSTYHSCGCIKTSKVLPRTERIARISQEIRFLIWQTKPNQAVVEKIFFAKNKTTALAVSESRGAILLELTTAGIPVLEFTPLEVKMAITGNGRAEKQQVSWVVKNILRIKEPITSDDALDALALSLLGGRTG